MIQVWEFSSFQWELQWTLVQMWAFPTFQWITVDMIQVWGFSSFQWELHWTLVQLWVFPTLQWITVDISAVVRVPKHSVCYCGCYTGLENIQIPQVFTVDIMRTEIFQSSSVLLQKHIDSRLTAFLSGTLDVTQAWISSDFKWIAVDIGGWSSKFQVSFNMLIRSSLHQTSLDSPQTCMTSGEVSVTHSIPWLG